MFIFSLWPGSFLIAFFRLFIITTVLHCTVSGTYAADFTLFKNFLNRLTQADNVSSPVPSLPYSSDEIQVSGYLAMGSRQPVMISAAAKIGLFMFAGTAGQSVSLEVSDVTIGSSDNHSTAIALYTPEQTLLQTPWSVGKNGGFLDAFTLPTTGLYTLVVDPEASDTGSLTLTLHNMPPDVPGCLAINGPALTAAVSTPGQNPTLKFSGKAGQQITVAVTNNTLCGVQVSLYSLNMTPLTSFFAPSCMKSFKLATQTLPTTDGYLIRVDPPQEKQGRFTLNITSP